MPRATPPQNFFERDMESSQKVGLFSEPPSTPLFVSCLRVSRSVPQSASIGASLFVTQVCLSRHQQPNTVTSVRWVEAHSDSAKKQQSLELDKYEKALRAKCKRIFSIVV